MLRTDFHTLSMATGNHVVGCGCGYGDAILFHGVQILRHIHEKQITLPLFLKSRQQKPAVL